MSPSLANGVFWIAVACCAVAQLAILRSVLRTPVVPQSEQVPHPRSGVEIAWAILPALALAGILMLTWQEIHAPTRPEPPRAEQLRLSGDGAIPKPQ